MAKGAFTLRRMTQHASTNSLSGVAIFGIVIAAVAAFLLCIFCFWCCCRDQILDLRRESPVRESAADDPALSHVRFEPEVDHVDEESQAPLYRQDELQSLLTTIIQFNRLQQQQQEEERPNLYTEATPPLSPNLIQDAPPTYLEVLSAAEMPPPSYHEALTMINATNDACCLHADSPTLAIVLGM